jgi:dTDP-4-dehydrorhamnose 3,5-epimerase
LLALATVIGALHSTRPRAKARAVWPLLQAAARRACHAILLALETAAMFERLAIPDMFSFTPKRHQDARGYFVETFVRSKLEAMTGPLDWVQDNFAYSIEKHSVRGLHFQIAPFAQDKLVWCGRGAVLDVAVDLRRKSPTYGRHAKTMLSAENGVQVFVPKGFAHGYITLTPDVEVSYKVTNYYSPEAERGVVWNDPNLAIDWLPAGEEPTLAPRDQKLPAFADLPAYF